MASARRPIANASSSTVLSLGNFLLLSSMGQCSYVALPIFPSRMFRHSAIFVRTDRGIEAPADLVGRSWKPKRQR